jgi:hypothetical protein
MLASAIAEAIDLISAHQKTFRRFCVAAGC